MHPEKPTVEPSTTQNQNANEKVPEPGRIVSRRIGPVGWFVLGLTALAVLIVAMMILR